MAARRSLSERNRLGASLRLLPGVYECSEAGCRRRTGLRCDYVDRRGRRCDTAWCPAHRTVADGEVLCRRHAGIRSALAPRNSGETPAAPDLDVRSPALVGWVADGVDSAIGTLLGAPGLAVTGSPVVLVLAPSGAARSWERRWVTDEHVVCLRVDEGEPDELAVLVDGTESARLVPPWIVDRRGGSHETSRRRFTDSVLGAVKAGMLPSTS